MDSHSVGRVFEQWWFDRQHDGGEFGNAACVVSMIFSYDSSISIWGMEELLFELPSQHNSRPTAVVPAGVVSCLHSYLPN